MNFKLEICTDAVSSAVAAMNAGANRIELCDNLVEGGTTPSYGTIVKAREMLAIPLHVIIRPRGGDFLYDHTEFSIMKKDIEFCKRAGADGIVVGLLTAPGRIDVKRTTELVELAFPMKVTFHRAFDMCADLFMGLEDIISTGAGWLLTSGQKNKAPDGTDLISGLVKTAGNRIIIMPGSGLNMSNIEAVARKTGATEFHLTARKVIDSRMEFRREGIQMGGMPGIPEFGRKVADTEHIKEIIKILKAIDI